MKRFEGACLGTQPGKIPPREVSARQEGCANSDLPAELDQLFENRFGFKNLRNRLFIFPL